MARFWIRYGLGGGFGGVGNWEEINVSSLEEAENEAYWAACEEYEAYGGMHGLLTIEDIMEEEELSEEEAEEQYREYRESWLDYEATDQEPEED